MSFKSFLYTALKISNDINAVQQAVKKRSGKPIANRIGRRLYGKATGRLAGKIFRP